MSHQIHWILYNKKSAKGVFHYGVPNSVALHNTLKCKTRLNDVKEYGSYIKAHIESALDYTYHSVNNVLETNWYLFWEPNGTHKYIL
jgi:hypothetical protein